MLFTKVVRKGLPGFFALEQRPEWREECGLQKPAGKTPHMDGRAGTKALRLAPDGLLHSKNTHVTGV